MKIFRKNSLMMRIWMTFTIMILIIVCCISLLYIFAFRAFDESSKMQDLKAFHETLAKSDNLNHPLGFNNLRNLKQSQNFTVNINGDKTQIEEVNKPQGTPPAPDEGDKKWMAQFVNKVGNSEKEFKEYHNNKKLLFIISEIKTKEAGKSYLVTYTPDFVDNSILYDAVVIGIIFIIIGFFTAKLVAGYISKPLKELEDFTRRIANKDWKEPIKVKNDDEIGSLANSMNIMQKELMHAEENEKMFLQSISHDLKTPVMVIMSHAQAIIDGIYIESVEKTAQIIKTESESLEKKIKQMLYLNTLDYVLENNIENENIKLHQVMNNMIHRFEMVNSNINWDLSIDSGHVFGNKEKIMVSIENVLDNALRYAKEKIVVTLKEQDGFAVLEIYNDGNNIQNKNIGQIFDNLYKDKTGNFGLGLAISKKIIDYYHGEIAAINREKGVSFIIKYPIKLF
jgi:two-component system sensor histidine kinase CssS